jgi:two-component system, OmpR family, sensor histidine kinase KdpD
LIPAVVAWWVILNAPESAHHTGSVRTRLVGSLTGVAAVAVLGLGLLPLRSHLAVSTVALILVIPVALGVVVGGFSAGLVSVTAGFLVYDFFYIPPYNTLNVGTTQNWTALGVYVVVMLLVSRIVANLDLARAAARRGEDAARRLSELSELLVGDQPVDALLTTIVSAAHTVFSVPGVSLLELDDGRLRVVASAGEALSDEELRRLEPDSGVPVSVGPATGAPDELRTVALVASGRPVGILALRGLPTSATDRAVLTTFANDAALALERARLRDQALRTQVLEEVDRYRQGLMGAVSHDLRTPLATIQVASSTLSNRTAELTVDQAHELYRLIEVESRRLTRLVANLLDQSRIEAGVLRVQRAPVPPAQLARDAVTALGPVLHGHHIEVAVPATLPDVDVDVALIDQAMINLLDNALRYSPDGGVITVTGRLDGERVTLAVSDEGPGIPPDQRDVVFHRFTRFDEGGRAGLGLTIARTFVEAHGESLWYEDAPGGGARFVLSLPVAHYDESVA